MDFIFVFCFMDMIIFSHQQQSIDGLKLLHQY